MEGRWRGMEKGWRRDERRGSRRRFPACPQAAARAPPLPPHLNTHLNTPQHNTQPHTQSIHNQHNQHTTTQQQPVFSTIEDIVLRCVPRLQFAGPKGERALRLGYRSAYVAVTTFIACALPFFDAFTGLVGAITFFPTAVAYPIMMYTR